MPPKKEQAEVDLNPFGAFVNASVGHAQLQLEPPTEAPSAKGKAAAKHAEADASPGQPPKLHLVLSLPGTCPPVVGQPTEHAGEGSYSLVFSGRSRREPTMEVMHELINAPARLSVMESASGTCLAAANIDMLEFGMGAQSIEPGTLELKPEQGIPASSWKVKCGTLHGVRLWLTHRPAPPSDTQTSRPTTPSGGHKQAGKGGADAAAVYPPEADLPPQEPFAFLTAEQLQGANVVELSVGSLQALPPSLGPAVAVATEGKAGGKVSFAAGLRLPLGPQVVVASGSLVAGEVGTEGPCVVFQPGSRRCFMTRQQVQALQDLLEDGQPLLVEVARYLQSETMADPAWQAYRAQAVVPGTQALLQPGTHSSDTAGADAALQPCEVSTPASEAVAALPSYTPPQGKSIKTMEEAPPAGTCMWAAAGSQASGLRVWLRNPLVPPWQPPPQPPVLLQQLVPCHSNLPPLQPPQLAMDAFSTEARSMLDALQRLSAAEPASDATSLKAELEAAGRLQQLKAALKQHAVSVAMEQYHLDLEGRPLDAVQVQAFLDSLNQQLAAAVDAAAAAVGPATESGSGSKATVDLQLQQLVDKAAECEAGGEWSRAADLHQQRVLLTSSGEQQGGTAGVDATQAAQVWYDYAAFCLRRGMQHQGRAEQALRQCLKQNAAHTPALAALCTLLLHQGCATDVLYLREATQLAHQLVQQAQQPGSVIPPSVAWGLLLLICQAAGDKAQAQDTAAALAGLLQAESCGQACQPSTATPGMPNAAHDQQEQQYVLARGVRPGRANGLCGVAELAASLHLPAVAVEAIQQAWQELPRSCSAWKVSLSLALSGAAAWAQIHAAAVKAADSEAGTASDTQPTADQQTPVQQQAEEALAQVLACCAAARAAGAMAGGHADWEEGGAHFVSGHWPACVSALARAVQAGSAPPLQVYLQLASSYQQLGQVEQACNVYMQACVRCPCATVWLGLAQCQAELPTRDTTAIQAALTQAAACDPDHPGVWAQLALEAFRAGRAQEAGVHVMNALQLGCEDGEVLVELASSCRKAEGLLRQARSCLERALQAFGHKQDLTATRLALAEVCLELGDAGSARLHLEAVMLAATRAGDEHVQERVNELVPRLLDLQLGVGCDGVVRQIGNCPDPFDSRGRVTTE